MLHMCLWNTCRVLPRDEGKNARWSRACFIVSQTQSTFWRVYLGRQGRRLARNLHRFAVDNKTDAEGDVLWCKSLKHTHSFKCTRDISVVSIPSSSSLCHYLPYVNYFLQKIQQQFLSLTDTTLSFIANIVCLLINHLGGKTATLD